MFLMFLRSSMAILGARIVLDMRCAVLDQPTMRSANIDAVLSENCQRNYAPALLRDTSMYGEYYRYHRLIDTKVILSLILIPGPVVAREDIEMNAFAGPLG